MKNLNDKKTEPILPGDILAERKEHIRIRQDWRRMVLYLGLTVAIVYVLAGILFGVAVVSGDSMKPAYQQGDFVLFNRLVHKYQWKDIVLLRMKDGNTYIKRVIGTPGDEVDIEEGAGTVLVNGIQIDESYLYEQTYKKSGVTYPVVLGDGEYFVMGDEREDSVDSRSFGVVTKKQIEGKVITALRMN